MRAELNNSEGQGGTGPDGSRNRLGNCGEGRITDSGSVFPARTVVSPAPDAMPRVLERDGRRRSASTNSTRLPSCAITIAQLMLVVVFPSCGSGLVTNIILGGASGKERRIEVRSARNASAISEFGRVYASTAASSPLCGPEGSNRRPFLAAPSSPFRSEEHTSELQSHSDLVCRLLLEKKKKKLQRTNVI